jgi:hypothetical protein
VETLNAKAVTAKLLEGRNTCYPLQFSLQLRRRHL